MGACQVEVNGDEYYVPCDRVDDINLIDGYLVNTGSSNITLYSDIITYGSNSSGYPRITLQPYTQSSIRTSQQAQQVAYPVNSYKVLSSHSPDTSIYMLLILGVLVCQFLKH